MSVIVPDASIIVKWALRPDDEPGTRTAMALISRWEVGDVDLVAPSLWTYEVANVLGRKAPKQATLLLDGLLALDIPTVHLDAALFGKALEIALRLSGVTVYDAAYHALALSVRGTFLTADERYVRRARRLGGVDLLGS